MSDTNKATVTDEVTSTTTVNTDVEPDKTVGNETKVRKLKIDLPCLFGCSVCVAFFILSLISKAILSNPNLVLDISTNPLAVFAALCCTVFGGLALIVCLLGLAINIVGLFIKTKFVSFYNYCIIGFSTVWVFLLIMTASNIN